MTQEEIDTYTTTVHEYEWWGWRYKRSKEYVIVGSRPFVATSRERAERLLEGITLGRNEIELVGITVTYPNDDSYTTHEE